MTSGLKWGRLFIVTLTSWGRRCISETSVQGCDGFIWTFAVFAPDVRRSRGGEGERSPDHQETSAVQDLQEVTSPSCDNTTQVSDGIQTTQDSENKAFLFSEPEEEFVLNICTVCLSVSFYICTLWFEDFFNFWGSIKSWENSATILFTFWEIKTIPSLRLTNAHLSASDSCRWCFYGGWEDPNSLKRHRHRNTSVRLCSILFK